MLAVQRFSRGPHSIVLQNEKGSAPVVFGHNEGRALLASARRHRCASNDTLRASVGEFTSNRAPDPASAPARVAASALSKRPAPVGHNEIRDSGYNGEHRRKKSNDRPVACSHSANARLSLSTTPPTRAPRYVSSPRHEPDASRCGARLSDFVRGCTVSVAHLLR